MHIIEYIVYIIKTTYIESVYNITNTTSDTIYFYD